MTVLLEVRLEWVSHRPSIRRVNVCVGTKYGRFGDAEVMLRDSTCTCMST